MRVVGRVERLELCKRHRGEAGNIKRGYRYHLNISILLLVPVGVILRVVNPEFSKAHTINGAVLRIKHRHEQFTFFILFRRCSSA